MLPALIKIDKQYKPEQTEPIHVLLGKLNELGTIFLTLNQYKQDTTADASSKTAEAIAKDVKETYEIVQEAIEDLLSTMHNEDFIEDALKMPLPQAYKVLLEPLRFDYMSMKRDGTTTYNHKYKDLVQSN